MIRPTQRSRLTTGAFVALLVGLLGVGTVLLMRDGPRPGSDDDAVVRRASAPSSGGALPGAELAMASSGPNERIGRAFETSLDSVGVHEAAAVVRANAPQLIGTVLDEAGEAIAGADILASTRWSRTSLGLDVDVDALRDICRTESDTLGFFRVPFGDEVPLLVPGRRGAVLVRAPGHAPELVATDRVPELPPLDMGQITLETGALVTGTVVGPDGLPISGARVFFGQTETRGALRVRTPSRGFEIAPTDSEGRFRCDELHEGPFHVLVDFEGLPLGYVEADARVGEPVEGLIVRLQRGAPIEGRVTGASDPTVLEIEAWLDDDEEASAVARRPRRVHPDATGAFSVGGLLLAREYELTVTGPSTGRRRPRTEPVRALAGEKDVELTWNERASVTGRLVARDVETSELRGVDSYLVWSADGIPEGDEFRGRILSADGGPAREHEGGRFLYPDINVDPGETRTMSFRFRAVGYRDLVVRGVEVAPAEAVDLGDLELEPGDVLRLQAIAESSGEPIEGARAFLVSAANVRSLDRARVRDDSAWSSDVVRFGETDAEGRAVLQLPNGDGPWRLAVNADSYPKGEPIEITNVEEEVVFSLRDGASVETIVLDGGGAPVSGMAVSLYARGGRGRWRGWEGSQGRTLKTDAVGRVVFENVEKGPSTLSASPPSMRPRRPKGWAEARTEIEVPEEGVVSETLTVPATARIVGRVVEAGAPLADARVSFAVREGRELLTPQVTSVELRAITGIDGRFVLEAVPVGSYEVGVVHRSRAMPTIVPLVVEPDMAELVLRLEDASIEGRVVSAATGDPVDGVSLEILGPNEVYNAYVGERTLYERRDGSLNERDDWARPGQSRADAEGEFVFRGLSIEVPLRLRVRGKYVVEKTVSLGRLGVGEVRRDVVVEVAAASALRVELDTSGAQREGRRRSRVGVRVWRLGRNGEPRGRPTQRYGSRVVRMSGLPPGKVRIETVLFAREGNEVLESRDAELLGLEELRLRMRGQ